VGSSSGPTNLREFKLSRKVDDAKGYGQMQTEVVKLPPHLLLNTDEDDDEEPRPPTSLPKHVRSTDWQAKSPGIYTCIYVYNMRVYVYIHSEAHIYAYMYIYTCMYRYKHV
jgi:hypothetical protein